MDEVPVHEARPFAPVGIAHASIIKKSLCRPICKLKTSRTTAMNQIGVLKGRDEGKTHLHPGCFGVTWSNQYPPAQRR